MSRSVEEAMLAVLNHYAARGDTSFQQAFMGHRAKHDWHEHKCGSCGEIWSHSRREGEALNSEAGYHERHNCPRCGVNQRTVHRWLPHPRS